MAEDRGTQRRARVALATGAVLLALGGWQLGSAGYIHAKAWLAQVLLGQAWAATLDETGQRKPWPWADTWPVARLQVPALGIDQIVLAGASGRTLAFGPGHLDGTAAPGGPGHIVLSGHRYTHFRFLQDLAPDTEIRIQRADGRWQSYRTGDGQVIDASSARFEIASDRPALTLVTCWPFDALETGGPLRYLVFAEADGGS
jgi:sortase A